MVPLAAAIHNNLGNLLSAGGRIEEALLEYEISGSLARLCRGAGPPSPGRPITGVPLPPV
jgi:hypothetical protein